MKNNKNIIIIILSVIILLLLFAFIGVLVYLKFDHLDDKEEFIPNPNSTTTGDKTSNYISGDEALEIALKSLNISRDSVYDVSTELDYKFGKNVYDIDFNYDRYEYEFYVDAKTGELLKSFRERD